MKNILYENTHGLIEFLIEIGEDVEYSMQFKVFEVTSRNLDDSPYGMEEYLTGSVKWDGCSNFNFGDEGYIHLCGKSGIITHNFIVSKVFELAESTITNFDMDVAY
jgi:hypothetical protein